MKSHNQLEEMKNHHYQALWIVFGSSQLGEGVLQEDFGLCLDLV